MPIPEQNTNVIHAFNDEIAITQYIQTKATTIAVNGKVIYTIGTLPVPAVTKSDVPNLADHPNITFVPEQPKV